MKLPRFTLRDLFWLVAVAAMGCAWWTERSRFPARLVPRLQVLELTRNLGNLPRNATGRCLFKVENLGDVPVYAESGPSSGEITWITPSQFVRPADSAWMHVG